MKHVLKLTLGEKSNRDPLYGFRNSRGQRFGKIVPAKGREIPPFWGNSLGQFLLFASRPYASRAGRNDGFDLLIECTTRATKEEIEDTHLRFSEGSFRIGDRCTVKIRNAKCQMPKAEIKAARGTVGFLPGKPGETLEVAFYSPDSAPKPKPKPKTKKETPTGSLEERIAAEESTFSRKDAQTALWNSPARKMVLYALDRTYWTVPRKLWEEILVLSQLDMLAYASERRDCDDFALYLKAECSLKHRLTSVGLAVDFSGGHAFNVLFVDDGDGVLTADAVEPQTDDYAEGKNYPMQKGFILL